MGKGESGKFSDGKGAIFANSITSGPAKYMMQNLQELKHLIPVYIRVAKYNQKLDKTVTYHEGGSVKCGQAF